MESTSPWQIGNLIESALQCGIEYTLDERTLARTRHTGDDGHDIERYLYVYASEVVHAGALDRQGAIPWTARCGYGYCLFTGKIFHGIRLRIVLDGSLRQLGHIAFEDDASSMLACIGTDIYQVVGGTHDFFVVFYHYHGIAQLLQFSQNFYQPLGVATVKSYGRFVKDIKRTHKRTADGGGKADALRFASRQTVGLAVQREVLQPNLTQVIQTIGNLCQQTFAYFLLVLR